MDAMAELYLDKIDRDEQIAALRDALRMAASRFQALANGEPAGPFKDLYARWASEARKAAENV